MRGKKIFDELKCEVCGKKLSAKQTLFDTAWSGVYWCGGPECALELLQECCEELSADNPCNWDD